MGAEFFHVKLDRGAHLKVDGPHCADSCRRIIPCSAKLRCLMVPIFFPPGATTPIGGCILQPSSGL